MKKREVVVPIIFLLLLVALPVVMGWQQSDAGKVFGGFVFNPLDGNTYLAKMHQGWRGDWKFVLPYTAEQSAGSYLFLYYLFLGHLARLLHLPLIWMYHLARLVNTVLLALALQTFFMTVFAKNTKQARLAFWLALFGGGLGWLAALAGAFTADLWVAEAYPFLASYANPHFPLGMTLLLWILIQFAHPARLHYGWLQSFVLGIALSIVMPFGIVVAIFVGGLVTTWAIFTREPFVPWRALIALAGGGLFLVYQYFIILRDPVLAGWNAQNITTSPPLWDLLVSFSPALLLGIYAVLKIIKRNHDPAERLLLVWFICGGLLVYVPFDLQRRFLFAYFIPAAAMAIKGLTELMAGNGNRRWLTTILFSLSIPTMLIVVMTGLFAGKSNNPLLYYSTDEASAMEWVENNAPENALVLASPEMGLFIPAHTGRRVLYGHPFETVDAEAARKEVEQFFAGNFTLDWMTEQHIQFVFLGARERKFGSPVVLNGLPVVYRNNTVVIYAVEQVR